MFDITSYILSMGYTSESLQGGGSLVGKNVVISSITPIDGGNRITFTYTLDDGTVKNSTLDVMNGVDGQDGYTPVKNIDYFDGKNGKDGVDGTDGTDGQDGVGILKVEKIKSEGLVDTYKISFTDGTYFNFEITNGADGVDGEKGKDGVDGSDGADGISPTISENADNNADTYKLDITNADGSVITTPNLKGTNSGGSGSGEENVQSDWNETDTTSDAYIKNKPTIPTVPTKVSELENDNNYLSSIPEEYITETELTAKDYATKTYVGEQIASVDHLSRSIVTTLPTDDEASEKVIYMLKVDGVEGNDKYQEYMKIDGTLQLVGDTSVDLSDYAKTVDVNAELDKKANTSDVTTLEETVTAHTDNTDIHATVDEKTAWNNKIDKSSIATTLDDTVTDEQVASALTVKNKIDSNELHNSANGTNSVTVKDSTKAPIISFKGNGYTEQQTYSGKNLLKNNLISFTLSGVTFSTNSDGSITANGTSTETYKGCYAGIVEATSIGNTNLKPGETYIFSAHSTNENLCLYLLYTSSSTTGWQQLFNPTAEEVIVTIPSDVGSVIIRAICLDSGVTLSNAKMYPMVRLASDTDSTFEPYVGATFSPNPDYPQEIKGYGELQEDGTYLVPVKSVGKNLFGGLTFAQKLVDSGNTSVSLNESDKTISYNRAISNYVLYDKFKEKTQYTFVFDGVSENSLNCINLQIVYKDGGSLVLQLGTTISKKDRSIKELRYVFHSSYVTTLNYEKCGIFEGAITKEEFEPYQESTALIPTSQPFYEGDYIQLNADGTGIEHREYKRIAPKTVLAVQQTGHLSNFAYVALDEYCSSANIDNYSNYLTDNYTTLGDGCLEFGNNTTGALSTAFFKIPDCTTKEQYDSWLTQHPDFEIVYKLTTPTDTSLTDEQLSEIRKLMSFDGETTFSTDPYNAEFDVQYYKNTENGKVVGGVENKIAETYSKTETDALIPSVDGLATTEYVDNAISKLSDYKWELICTITGSEEKSVPKLSEYEEVFCTCANSDISLAESRTDIAIKNIVSVCIHSAYYQPTSYSFAQIHIDWINNKVKPFAWAKNGNSKTSSSVAITKVYGKKRLGN